MCCRLEAGGAEVRAGCRPVTGLGQPLAGRASARSLWPVSLAGLSGRSLERRKLHTTAASGGSSRAPFDGEGASGAVLYAYRR